MLDIFVGAQFFRSALPDHAAALQNAVLVGQADQALHILVHHQNGLAGGAQNENDGNKEEGIWPAGLPGGKHNV